jgi:predicted nucleic acid-binding protein
MTSDAPNGNGAEAEDFDAAQQALMVEIGQALMAHSTSGVVALELIATQAESGEAVELDLRLNLERQSGLTVPAEADDALVALVQRLVLLWRGHGRDPWRTFTYRLSRSPSGPQFTSEFDF